MNETGVRPRKMSHWAAIAIIAATVWHNPGGSAELAITTLDGLGSGLGWMLDRGGMDGESHYFEGPAAPEPQTPDTEPGPETGPPVTIAASESSLRGTADDVVVEIVNLHELVEEVLTEDDGQRDRFDS